MRRCAVNLEVSQLKIQCGDVDESVCPTGALKANPLSIDMGKCTLCGACKCQSGTIQQLL